MATACSIQCGDTGTKSVVKDQQATPYSLGTAYALSTMQVYGSILYDSHLTVHFSQHSPCQGHHGDTYDSNTIIYIVVMM